MKKYILIFFVLLSAKCFSQINVVPMPAEVKMGQGFSVIKQPIGFILIDADMNENDNDGSQFFKKYLNKRYGLKKFIDGNSHSYGLSTEIYFSILEENKITGAYEIEVKEGKIYIYGSNLGKFYAFETLKQLITKNLI